jgi:hypothetical protein
VKEVEINSEEFFERYGEKLKYSEDLKRLISESVQNKKTKLLSDLAFSAKFTKGLVNVIQKNNQDVNAEYFKRMELEYLTIISSIRDMLRELVSTNDFLLKVFEKKYFALTHQALNNLNGFCVDLSYLKLYLNDKKK